jgi:hypothetical protein
MISHSEMVGVERKCVMHTTGITVIKNLACCSTYHHDCHHQAWMMFACIAE